MRTSPERIRTRVRGVGGESSPAGAEQNLAIAIAFALSTKLHHHRTTDPPLPQDDSVPRWLLAPAPARRIPFAGSG
jgi:hypothetical protein